MPITVAPTVLPEVLLLEPPLFADARGSFYESFNARDFAAATGLTPVFVQDNHSRSGPGVLRGLHYQLGRPQGKLLRVVRGAIFDVAVDLRRDSPRFGKWVGVTLSAEDRKQLWIPEGFGHGFVVVGGEAEVLYKTTAYRYAEGERTIRWNDATLGIQWPLVGAPVLSAKDAEGVPFAEAEVY
jgi:dTDP-4-dehydrorhamnose 3,5-epimerase